MDVALLTSEFGGNIDLFARTASLPHRCVRPHTGKYRESVFYPHFYLHSAHSFFTSSPLSSTLLNSFLPRTYSSLPPPSMRPPLFVPPVTRSLLLKSHFLSISPLFPSAPLSSSSLHSLPCFMTDLSSLCPPPNSR